MTLLSEKFYMVLQGAHQCCSAEGLTTSGNRTTLSGYDNLEQFFIKHGAEVQDGSPVIDLYPIRDRDDIVHLSFRAPLPDVRLAEGEIDRWKGHPGNGFAGVIAGNYFGAEGAKAAMSTTTDEPGPYDNVPPALLAAYWKKHGARIGTWSGGEVVWDD